VLAYAALAIACTLPTWHDPVHNFVGSADAQQKMWFLNWTPFAITHGHNPFVTTYLNQPAGVNLLWNTSVPGPAVLLAPVTSVWGAVATYNVLTTGALALSAFFAFIAVRRYVHNTAAAASGGLLYGFSPAMMAQEHGHATPVISAVMIPIALLLFDEVFIRQRLHVWVLGCLVALYATFQYFTSPEFLATSVVSGLVLAVVLAAVHRDRVRTAFPYAARALGLGAVVAAGALAYPLVRVQLGGPDRVHGVIHSADIFSTTPLNFFIPEGNEWLSPSWLSPINSRFSGNASEANAYIGIPLLIAVAVLLRRSWNQTLVRTAAITGIVIAVFSLGPHFTPLRKSFFPLPWHPFSRLPLLSDVQPSRMMFFVFLALAVLFAYMMDGVWRRERRVWVTAGLAVVTLLPLFPKVPLPSQTLLPAPYFSTTAVTEIPAGAVAYTMPFPSQAAVEPMNWQRDSGMRFQLIGGYFVGPPSPGQSTLMHVAETFSSAGRTSPISNAERRRFYGELRANGIRVLIVAPIPHQADAVAFCTTLLGRPPIVRDGFRIWIGVSSPNPPQPA